MNYYLITRMLFTLGLSHFILTALLFKKNHFNSVCHMLSYYWVTRETVTCIERPRLYKDHLITPEVCALTTKAKKSGLKAQVLHFSRLHLDLNAVVVCRVTYSTCQL